MKYLSILLSILLFSLISCDESNTGTSISKEEQIIGCWLVQNQTSNGEIMEGKIGRLWQFKENSKLGHFSVSWEFTDEGILIVDDELTTITLLSENTLKLKAELEEDGEIKIIEVELERVGCPVEDIVTADFTGTDFSKFKADWTSSVRNGMGEYSHRMGAFFQYANEKTAHIDIYVSKIQFQNGSIREDRIIEFQDEDYEYEIINSNIEYINLASDESSPFSISGSFSFEAKNPYTGEIIKCTNGIFKMYK